MRRIAEDYDSHSNDFKGAADYVVSSLCNLISKMTEDEKELILYDAHNKTARECVNWWEEHQEADRKRIEEKLQKIQNEKDRTAALKKLSEHERKLLGIK